MANGLAGHELDFYDYVNRSRWINRDGGIPDYSTLNEGFPYWYNGIVPLAYLLDDPRLIDQVQLTTLKVFAQQGNDSWIGPETNRNERNFWGRTPFLLGLAQYCQTKPVGVQRGDCAGLIYGFMIQMNGMLTNDGEGLANCPDQIECFWGQVRVADLMLPIQWLIDSKHLLGGWGENAMNVSLLFENLRLLDKYTTYRWTDFYDDINKYPKVVTDPTRDNPQYPFLHGVNVGQGQY